MAPVAPAPAKQTNNDKAAVAAAAAAARPHEQAVQKCPRCDSANTKFCYYNNYSLTQPRHFCKTCRRYWTKGGALRNVPIGGGCRKNKRARPSSSSSSSKSATDIGGLKFFQGFTPAMDYASASASASTYAKPGGSLFGTTQSSSFLDISTSVGSAPLMGLNFHHHQQQMGHVNANANANPPPPPQISSLASSIESLSYINQDLHWKLQQQRLTMLFTGDQQIHESQTQNQIIPFGGSIHDQKPSPQPILFQNLEMEAAADDPKPNDHHHHLHHHGGGLSSAVADHHQRQNQNQNDDGDNMLSSRSVNSLSTEWFFDSCYAPVTPNPNSHGNNSNINWNGMPAWSPYSAI